MPPEIRTQNIQMVFEVQPKGKTSQSCCEALPILLITWVVHLCMGGGDPVTLKVFVLSPLKLFPANKVSGKFRCHEIDPEQAVPGSLSCYKLHLCF